MKTLRLNNPVILAPALLVITPFALDHEIAFSPESDTSVTKSFVSEMEFNLDDMSVMVDDQDIGAMMGAFEMSMTSDSEISVSDTYVSVADGRPTELKRTFDVLEANTSVDFATEFGGESQDIPSSSPLEGATVIYTWNEDEGEYDVAYEEDGGDEDLLDGLIEDFDLRTMLPSSPVSVGDSWTIDSKALAELAMQAQSLHLMPDEMGEEEMEMMETFMNDDFMSMMEDLYEGSMTCTLKGMREVEGETLADIELSAELNSSADMADMILEVIASVAETQGEEMPPIDLSTADLNADFEGEGMLVWNVSTNMMHVMELSGDFSVAFDIAASIDDDGEEHNVDASFEMSGTITTKAKAE